jgi:predicted small secreted protein
MNRIKAATAILLCVALAGCNLSNTYAGAGVSIGSGGVNVSPYVGTSLGRVHVGIGR